MANQFPNKLITLRKHFNYSQQDIAEIMGVPVAEYMKWENGSKLCTISQLSKLADTFKVTLDELFDNSIEITLPVLELENSIEIPFQNALGKNIPNITTENIITDDIFETEEVNQTSSLDKTIVTRIITDNTLEVIEPEETMVLKKPKVTIEPKKESKPKTKDSKSVKNNKNLVILASVAGVALFSVIFYFLFFNSGKNSINDISNLNRLVAAKEYSLYLSSEGNIVSHGNNPSTTNFLHTIQISAKGKTALGLNKDGTVACSGTDCDSVKDWEKIKMISASNNTLLGLTEDKTVMCSGSNCNVEEWEDVTFIHASDEGVYGISEGKLLYSGTSNINSKIQSVSGIQSLNTSSTYLTLLSNTGTVEVIPLGSASTPITNTWTNITQIATGSDFVAGLSSNGNVSIVGNEEIVEEVSKWTNIKYIAAYDNYIIGINNNNLMVGAGDNTYGQYENNSITPTESSDTLTKLDKVSNVKFSESDKVLTITWDSVANADFYQVSVNILGNYTVKTQTNSLKIDSSKLSSNTNYMISIVSSSNNEAEYESSDAYVINYQYIGATPTPEVKQYSVIFYDYDGKTVLSEQKVDEGSNAIAPADPKRDGYTFMGWKGDYFNINKDTKIYATYDKVQVATYKIVFKNFDGSIITSMVLEQGAEVNPPKLEGRLNSIVSWNPQVETTATRDITYSPIYVCTIYNSDGNILQPDGNGDCSCPSGTKLDGNKCIVDANPEGTN